ERDGLFEETGGGDRAGRVVRVVDEHEARAVELVCRDRAEVWCKPAFGQERKEDGLGVREQWPPGVDGVARIAGERDIVRIEEREVDVIDAFLAAKRGQHLRVGIERDAEAPLVKARDCLTECWPSPVRRILVR